MPATSATGTLEGFAGEKMPLAVTPGTLDVGEIPLVAIVGALDAGGILKTAPVVDTGWILEGACAVAATTDATE